MNEGANVITSSVLKTLIEKESKFCDYSEMVKNIIAFERDSNHRIDKKVVKIRAKELLKKSIRTVVWVLDRHLDHEVCLETSLVFCISPFRDKSLARALDMVFEFFNSKGASYKSDIGQYIYYKFNLKKVQTYIRLKFNPIVDLYRILFPGKKMESVKDAVTKITKEVISNKKRISRYKTKGGEKMTEKRANRLIANLNSNQNKDMKEVLNEILDENNDSDSEHLLLENDTEIPTAQIDVETDTDKIDKEDIPVNKIEIQTNQRLSSKQKTAYDLLVAFILSFSTDPGNDGVMLPGFWKRCIGDMSMSSSEHWGTVPRIIVDFDKNGLKNIEELSDSVRNGSAAKRLFHKDLFQKGSLLDILSIYKETDLNSYQKLVNSMLEVVL